MVKKILILDDDIEFNNLLMDVFKQADYEVLTAESAESAFEILQQETVDLIVADQRLPQESGLDFIKRVRREEYDIPLIMVSGYLDNDTIRELIREGVNGIFIKPLNIFSLLKKTGNLIETRELRLKSAEGNSLDGLEEGSRLMSIPCLSESGREFLNRATEICNFSRTLLLIGPFGMPYDEICRDIIRLGGKRETLINLKAGQISADRLQNELTLDSAVERITIGVYDSDKLSDEEAELLMSIDSPEGGPILRMIFSFPSSIEELYDSGQISEDFYLFLGSHELHVPPLKEMPEDLVAIAERELRVLSSDWRLDTKVKTLLCRHEWKENLMELRGVILRAATLSRPLLPEARHFEIVLQQTSEEIPEDGKKSTSTFEQFLLTERTRYEKAFKYLLS